MNMKNTIALITGGSRGLGKNMALNLAKKGSDIILTYNTKKEYATRVAEEIQGMGRKATVLELNTGDVNGFDEFVKRLKVSLQEVFQTDTIDFLVNNAGIGIHAAFMNTTEAQFDELMNIHFKGTFFLTQKVLPLIQDGGRIVNLSSGLARFSNPGYAAYGSMKGAIETLTRYLAKELGPRRIGVNVVAPGAIETDFGGGAVRDNAELNKAIAVGTALGRVGLPEDIGGVVAFLCSPESAWINGQRLEVSGGFQL
jgi:NAD(P)-dependent dehydrogenase (short-subunit alcohol dehydrogenase family)